MPAALDATARCGSQGQLARPSAAETLSANPDDTALTWISIGRAWLEREEPDWAHACLENAAAAPENDAVHHELGFSWHRKNWLGQAQPSGG